MDRRACHAARGHCKVTKPTRQPNRRPARRGLRLRRRRRTKSFHSAITTVTRATTPSTPCTPIVLLLWLLRLSAWNNIHTGLAQRPRRVPYFSPLPSPSTPDPQTGTRAPSSPTVRTLKGCPPVAAPVPSPEGLYNPRLTRPRGLRRFKRGHARHSVLQQRRPPAQRQSAVCWWTTVCAYKDISR